MDDDKTVLKLQKDQRKRVEKDSRERRNRDHDYRESEHESNRKFSMQHPHDKRKSARKVEDFGGNPALATYDDKDALRSELVMPLKIIKRCPKKILLLTFSLCSSSSLLRPVVNYSLLYFGIRF